MVVGQGLRVWAAGVLIVGASVAHMGGCDNGAGGAKAVAVQDAPAQPEDPSPTPTTTPTTSPPTTPAPASDPGTQQPAVEPAPKPANPPLPTMKSKLGGKTFALEMAMDDETRFHGLTGRTEIAEDGGMIFVFRQNRLMQFVMRDCGIDIDIIFVDASGRITAMHNMKAEAPRAEDEKQNAPGFAGAPQWAWINEQYENRLKKYPSRFDACIAIELKGGTLDIEGGNPGKLKLKVGEKLDLDVPLLRQKAK